MPSFLHVLNKLILVPQPPLCCFLPLLPLLQRRRQPIHRHHNRLSAHTVDGRRAAASCAYARTPVPTARPNQRARQPPPRWLPAAPLAGITPPITPPPPPSQARGPHSSCPCGHPSPPPCPLKQHTDPANQSVSNDKLNEARRNIVEVKTGNGNSCSPREIILKARLLLRANVCLRVSSSVLAFAPSNLQHFSFLYCIRFLPCNPLVRGRLSGRQQVHTRLRFGVFEGAGGLFQVRKALLDEGCARQLVFL